MRTNKREKTAAALGDEAPVLILAGGAARRLGGGDKGLRSLGGRPILSHLLDRLRGQTDTILINSGGDAARFAPFDGPVLPDVVPGGLGPLVGILTGMVWVKTHRPTVGFIITVPTDTPFMPRDLVRRLVAVHQAAPDLIVTAASGGRLHPTIGLFPIGYADSLVSALTAERLTRVQSWIARYPHQRLDFPIDPIDPFFNINTPDDLVRAEAILAADPASDAALTGGAGSA